MSNIRHTPGPWSARKPDGSNGHWEINAASIEQVATAWSALNGKEEANARLIAAAPEMADVLRPQLSKKARALVEDYIEAARAMDDGSALGDALAFLLERQDAAKIVLAKAEGQS